jgi:hypothetical protein
VCATIETHDRALLYAAYTAVVDLGEDGQQKVLQGEQPASGTPIRATRRFYTTHPDHRWHNCFQCLSIARAFLERAETTSPNGEHSDENLDVSSHAVPEPPSRF